MCLGAAVRLFVAARPPQADDVSLSPARPALSQSLVINVEYNQLDPLLSSQGDRRGDVADPRTGYSPYPGNANNIVLEMDAYARTLRGEDEGVVLEFVK